MDGKCNNPDVPDTNSPIPYYPGLREYVPTVTAAVAVIYLETRYPAPQDDPRRLSSLPVEVPIPPILAALKINRRTLELLVNVIAKVFKEEEERWSSARGAREFLIPRHRQKGTHKLYSVVTNGYNLRRAPSIILRRNVPLMRQALQSAGATPLSTPYDPAPHIQHLQQLAKRDFSPTFMGTNHAGAPDLIKSPRSLAEIMLSASVLSGDRRSVRYPRLRQAVEAGLEKPEVLRQKRKLHLQTVNEAVEPDLPEEVAERLIHLREDDLGGATGRRKG